MESRPEHGSSGGSRKQGSGVRDLALSLPHPVCHTFTFYTLQRQRLKTDWKGNHFIDPGKRLKQSAHRRQGEHPFLGQSWNSLASLGQHRCPALKSRKQGPHHKLYLLAGTAVPVSHGCALRQRSQQAVLKQAPDNLEFMPAFLLDSRGLKKPIPRRSIRPQCVSLSFFVGVKFPPVTFSWTLTGILPWLISVLLCGPYEVRLICAYSSHWSEPFWEVPHCLLGKGNATSFLSKETLSLTFKTKPVKGWWLPDFLRSDRRLLPPLVLNHQAMVPDRRTTYF